MGEQLPLLLVVSKCGKRVLFQEALVSLWVVFARIFVILELLRPVGLHLS